MAHEIRDAVVDYLNYWKDRADLPAKRLLSMVGLCQATFCKWCRSYGKEYEHNASIPRDHWLASWERDAIVKFHFEHPLDGYRRLTYMMLDAGILAVSATTVYRVLSGAGPLGRNAKRTKTQRTGFNQPDASHRHWHVDLLYDQCD